jgi:hypothetical protein
MAGCGGGSLERGYGLELFGYGGRIHMEDVMPKPLFTQTYLGDAVYASFDGYQICLRTGDGNEQVIYLEPGTFHELRNYANRIWGES